jgi:thioredoxin 1
MQVLNSAEFTAKIKESNGPVVIDFFAEWCGPCKMLSPILESIAPDFEGKLEIAKVDIDASGDIAQEYGITSVPTIIIFKDGKEAERMVGFQSKDSLSAKFQNSL